MKYFLKFKGNDMFLLENNRTVLKCKSSGFIFHFNFQIQNEKNQNVLKYKYHTLFSYENVKIIEQETEEKIQLIKGRKHFYTLNVGNKNYRIEDKKGFFPKNIGSIFLNNKEIGKINYGYLKSPWKIEFNFENHEPDIYILILLIIKYSHFDAEPA